MFKVDDYVTSQAKVGYFRIEKVVRVNRQNPATGEREVVDMLLTKHILNKSFAVSKIFYISFHPFWCQKVDEKTKAKIVSVLDNVKIRTKIDSYNDPEKTIFGVQIIVNKEEEQEFHNLVSKLENVDLRDVEISENPFFIKNRYEYNIGKKGKTYGILFVNFNLETDKDNFLIYRLEEFKENEF